MANRRIDPDLNKFIGAALFISLLAVLFMGIPGRIAQYLFGVPYDWAFFITWATPLVLLFLVMGVVLVRQRVSPDRPK